MKRRLPQPSSTTNANFHAFRLLISKWLFETRWIPSIAKPPVRTIITCDSCLCSSPFYNAWLRIYYLLEHFFLRGPQWYRHTIDRQLYDPFYRQEFATTPFKLRVDNGKDDSALTEYYRYRHRLCNTVNGLLKQHSVDTFVIESLVYPDGRAKEEQLCTNVQIIDSFRIPSSLPVEGVEWPIVQKLLIGDYSIPLKINPLYYGQMKYNLRQFIGKIPMEFTEKFTVIFGRTFRYRKSLSVRINLLFDILGKRPVEMCPFEYKRRLNWIDQMLTNNMKEIWIRRPSEQTKEMLNNFRPVANWGKCEIEVIVRHCPCCYGKFRDSHINRQGASVGSRSIRAWMLSSFETHSCYLVKLYMGEIEVKSQGRRARKFSLVGEIEKYRERLPKYSYEVLYGLGYQYNEKIPSRPYTGLDHRQVSQLLQRVFSLRIRNGLAYAKDDEFVEGRPGFCLALHTSLPLGSTIGTYLYVYSNAFYHKDYRVGDVFKWKSLLPHQYNSYCYMVWDTYATFGNMNNQAEPPLVDTSYNNMRTYACFWANQSYRQWSSIKEIKDEYARSFDVDGYDLELHAMDSLIV